MINDNAEATRRLHALVARLSDDDLTRDLGGGWTVTTALGHLAFWDRWQRLALAAGRQDAPSTTTEDAANEVLTPLLTALHPRTAANLALDAARDLDAAIEQTPETLRTQFDNSPHPELVRRSPHRLAHIAKTNTLSTAPREPDQSGPGARRTTSKPVDPVHSSSLQIHYPPPTMDTPPIQYARTEDGVDAAWHRRSCIPWEREPEAGYSMPQ